MFRLIFCVIFVAVAWFFYSEMKRKKLLITAKEDLVDSKTKEQELKIRQKIE